MRVAIKVRSISEGGRVVCERMRRAEGVALVAGDMVAVVASVATVAVSCGKRERGASECVAVWRGRKR